MKKVSVMLVDDHILIREVVRYAFSQLPLFEVIAESGDSEQAIILARDLRPDVIILDINLSPMNGFDTLKMLRKISPVSKIIGLSMHAQPAFAKKMIRLGARGYVTKNSHWTEIIQGIQEVLMGNIFICREIKDILSKQLLSSEADSPNINILSEREMQTIRLLSEGLSSKEIGVALNISSNTVEVHRSNIYKKLKLKNTTSLMNYINSAAFEL